MTRSARARHSTPPPQGRHAKPGTWPAAQVAASHGVSCPTVQAAVAEHAAVVFGEPGPTAVIGIDETRFAQPEVGQERRGEAAADRPVGDRVPALAGGPGLLGQVTGRTNAAVIEWLSVRTAQAKELYARVHQPRAQGQRHRTAAQGTYGPGP